MVEYTVYEPRYAADDPIERAERLRDRLAEHDAAVFRGVMEVDVQVALGLQGDVDH